MKRIFLVGVLLVSSWMFGQKPLSKKDSTEIVSLLFKQQADWNRGDIDEFMKGYLKSDELVFSGSSGPIYGWEATRARYKKSYSNRVLMGELKFDILNLIALSPKVAQLQGKFYLTREIDDSSGYFTLTWLKVSGQWLIISDHTSVSTK
ncbi:MAG: nuclear transport factor 2 family protein [Flavobacteriaceae bacterium]